MSYISSLNINKHSFIYTQRGAGGVGVPGTFVFPPKTNTVQVPGTVFRPPFILAWRGGPESKAGAGSNRGFGSGRGKG